jgi:hypothetical protein
MKNVSSLRTILYNLSLASILYSCANLNDGMIRISNDISLFRSGDTLNYLVPNVDLNLDAESFFVIRLGKRDDFLALEVVGRSNDSLNIVSNAPPYYYVINLKTYEVFGKFDFTSFQDYMKQTNRNIPLASPYNLEEAGLD